MTEATGLSFEKYAEERHFDRALRQQWRELEPSERIVVNELITELRPSANLLRDLLRLGKEIACRDDCSLCEVLGAVECQAVLARGGSRKERQRELRERLLRSRYPAKSVIQDRLSELSRELTSRHGLRLQLPDDLEGDRVGISLRTSSPADAARLAERLLGLSRDPDFQQIFDILLGKLEIE